MVIIFVILGIVLFAFAVSWPGNFPWEDDEDSWRRKLHWDDYDDSLRRRSDAPRRNDLRR